MVGSEVWLKGIDSFSSLWLHVGSWRDSEDRHELRLAIYLDRVVCSVSREDLI